MFFILSKVLFFLIRPINWIVFCLLFGLFSKKEKRRRRFLWFGTGMLLFFTNPFFANLIMQAWEVPSPAVRELASYEVGIVLGGYVHYNSSAPEDRLNLNERPNRLIQAIQLYHSGKIKKILLSGAAGTILDPRLEEDPQLTGFLMEAGIPEQDIWVEPRSKNTFENIRFSKELIREQSPDANILLITSAFHIRRALAICQKEELTCTPFSTDKIAEPIHWSPNSWLLPDHSALQTWEIMIKEWVGFGAYRLKGYL
jgi:uncharacterized SAM-binding protein YcdF (DUF218 family)